MASCGTNTTCFCELTFPVSKTVWKMTSGSEHLCVIFNVPSLQDQPALLLPFCSCSCCQDRELWVEGAWFSQHNLTAEPPKQDAPRSPHPDFISLGRGTLISGSLRFFFPCLLNLSNHSYNYSLGHVVLKALSLFLGERAAAVGFVAMQHQSFKPSTGKEESPERWEPCGKEVKMFQNCLFHTK